MFLQSFPHLFLSILSFLPTWFKPIYMTAMVQHSKIVWYPL